MTSNDIPVSKCWSCDHRFDAATDTQGNARPKPGDVTVCINCAALHRFNDDLTLRPATITEIDDPETARQVRRAVATIKKRGPIDGIDGSATYQVAAELTHKLVGEFLARATERPAFAMPERKIVIAASITDDVARRMPRNDAAWDLLSALLDGFDSRKLDPPTVLMLRVALEMHGVSVTEVSLSDLGIEPLTVMRHTKGPPS